MNRKYFGCSVEGCSSKHEGLGYCQRHYHQIRKYGNIVNYDKHAPNETCIVGNAVSIQLYSHGKPTLSAIVDAEDIQKVASYRWYAVKLKFGGYVCKTNTTGRLIQLHSLIMNYPSRDMAVYPLNGNLLDCRKSNLNVDKRGKYPRGITHFVLARKAGFKPGHNPWNRGLKGFMSGSNHANWRGGLTPLSRSIRTCVEYTEWRLAIFERDDYTCIFCGDKRGGNLNADHIKPFSVIIRENSITSLRQAQECNELWEITNGRTLCEPCHINTPTYGVGALSYA